MNDGNRLRIGVPVRCGERVICPVIREERVMQKTGIFVTVQPVALLVQEQESWFYVAIDDSMPKKMPDDLIPPATGPCEEPVRAPFQELCQSLFSGH